MKLYHGTSGVVARKALSEGITPRGRRKGNFVHTVESSPYHVYLTDAYAAYFSFNAAKKGEAAILEVETDLLHELNLNADEDVLEQAGRGVDGLNPTWEMRKRTEWYRRRLTSRRFDWKASLNGMGTCTHFGIIPPSAITRVAFIDSDHPSVSRLRLMALDASISIMNYRFMEKKYKALNRWIFGDHSEEDIPKSYEMPVTDYATGERKMAPFQEYNWPPAENRRGVRVEYLNLSSG